MAETQAAVVYALEVYPFLVSVSRWGVDLLIRDRLKQMRKRDWNLCRYGCNVVESPEHVLLHCRHVKKPREVLNRICEKRDLEFSIKTLLCDSHLQIGVEKLMADFLKSCPDTIT